MQGNPFADLIPNDQPAQANPFVDLVPQDDASEGFSARRMVENIPASAAQYGKNVVSAVTSPSDTLKALGLLASDVFTGRTGQEIGRYISDPENYSPEATSGQV